LAACRRSSLQPHAGIQNRSQQSMYSLVDLPNRGVRLTIFDGLSHTCVRKAPLSLLIVVILFLLLLHQRRAVCFFVCVCVVFQSRKHHDVAILFLGRSSGGQVCGCVELDSMLLSKWQSCDGDAMQYQRYDNWTSALRRLSNMAIADVSHCCGPTDICLSNGLCWDQDSTYYNRMVRASCTDNTWASSSCPQYCTTGQSSRQPLIIRKPVQTDATHSG
jgi:hypothetical protein